MLDIPDDVVRERTEPQNEFLIRSHREARRRALDRARAAQERYAILGNVPISSFVEVLNILDDIVETGFV